MARFARLLRRTEFVWVQREIAWAMGGMDGRTIAVVCGHAHSSARTRESVLPKPETPRFHNAKIDSSVDATTLPARYLPMKDFIRRRVQERATARSSTYYVIAS